MASKSLKVHTTPHVKVETDVDRCTEFSYSGMATISRTFTPTCSQGNTKLAKIIECCVFTDSKQLWRHDNTRRTTRYYACFALIGSTGGRRVVTRKPRSHGLIGHAGAFTLLSSIPPTWSHGRGKQRHNVHNLYQEDMDKCPARVIWHVISLWNCNQTAEILWDIKQRPYLTFISIIQNSRVYFRILIASRLSNRNRNTGSHVRDEKYEY